MNFFKRLFDFYINASIHVALSVCALCAITFLKYGINCDLQLIAFVFFASITGYNFVKYFGLAKFHHRSLAGWLKSIQLFSLFCFIAMGVYAWRLSFKSIVFLGLMGLITFLYAVPFLPRRFLFDQQQNLRSIGGLKVFVIAMVWSGVTVFLPLVEVSIDIDVEVILLGIQRFVLVLILMLPFEIRDLQYDSLKLATIPQKIGVKQTKLLGVALVVLHLLFEYIISGNEMEWTNWALAVLLLLVLLYSRKRQAPYFCSFFVEAIPIFWLLMMLVA